MNGNMSYLLDFKEFNGGYVTFGGGVNGGRITGKGTIKTDNLDFKDVYFVKELKFNFYSVSQIYTWVFFLETKDETTGILKKFITKIKNLVDKKVMIIRCDNETEFKNSVMNDFCAMKADFKLPTTFWTEAVNTASYVQNRALVVKPHNKTLYELFRGRIPALSFMRPFGCHVTILNTLDHLSKFDGKADEGFFVGYSMNSTKDSIGAGQSSMKTGSTQDYIFMPLWKDGSPLFYSSPKISDDVGSPPSGDVRKKHDEVSDKESGALNKLNSSFENLNTEYPDDPKMPGLETIKLMMLLKKRPTRVAKALSDPAWVEEMQEELLQFKLQKMDIKSTFLYGRIKEEVYVCQPLGFEDLDHPEQVYKVVKALYGLYQAPRAWYETLAKYLLGNGFHKGQIDQTLFIKRQKGLQVKQKEDRIFISQDKYVAEVLRKFNLSDVKYASTPVDMEKTLVKDVDGDDVDVHLYRSMIESLMYLIASRLDIMYAVCVCARFQVIPKVSHLYAVKRIFRYLKGHPKLGLWYPRDSLFELVAYTDSDHAGASLDRKSTTRGCQFLGSRLIS
nr:hypothetical protein [Tanacetum cinerariifolium]